MPTSARWEVPNSPKTPVKTVHPAGAMWVNNLGLTVGIAPYEASRELRRKFAEVFLH